MTVEVRLRRRMVEANEKRRAAGLPELTQRALARKAGVEEARLSEHLNNKRLPSLPILARYAEALGCCLCALICPTTDASTMPQVERDCKCVKGATKGGTW